MDPNEQPAYDAAVSFLADDEALAVRLADRLRRRWKVFVFSERQKELAGTDGVETFSAVFKERCRMGGVLHRENWGETRWTRVEASAIKDHGLNKGWDTLFVVKLDDSTLPIWIPDTKIWSALDEYGLDGAAAAIDARLEGLGAKPHVETPVERARRLKAEAEREADAQAFLESERGVEAAQQEMIKLADHLEERVRDVRAEGLNLSLHRDPNDRYVFWVNGARVSMSMGWHCSYSNTTRHSSLLIRERDGPYGLGWPAALCPVVSEIRVSITVDATGAPAWQEEDHPDRYYSSRQLGDRYLNRLLDREHESEL